MPVNINDLISQMTLVEKASLLSGDDFWRTRAIDRLKVPQMAFADGPHGLRKQASEGDHLGLVKGVEATCFPTSATLANSWDIAVCDEVGRAIGAEAHHHHVNVLLGPGLNIKRNPLCGRNFEYFSEDPYLSGKLASAFTKGVQTLGVGACLKHFAANNQEYLRMTNDSIVDERTLQEIYLTGFEIAVKEAKPKAVMTSYNKINGTYAHENKYLLTDILVETWGFDGMVVSDWGGSNDAVESARAGANIEMPSTGYDSVNQLIEAVQSGFIEESIIDMRVSEYLKVLYETEIKTNSDLDLDQHHLIAQKAAEASMVLLKNEAVLPLDAKTRVAVIGDFAKVPRYQGAGSSMVNPYKIDTVLDVVNQVDLNYVGFAQGYERCGAVNTTKKAEALELARQADVVLLYIGLNEINEAEGQDRTHLKISDTQVDLLNALSNEPVKLVAIISSGSVVEMPWAQRCDAILHAQLSGQAGALAVLNVIRGKVNPSGKLAETYPVRYEDVPSAAFYPGAERTSEYREGLYVGYRYYDKAKAPVQFPFGFGLSYTTFEYSELNISEASVSCKVSNTGSVAGHEVVQLYVGKDQTRIHRPEKELKGFAKVFLEPGETKTVTIPFDAYTFRYYDVNLSAFAVEEGIYKVSLASSSRDVRLSGEKTVTGIVPQADDTAQLNAYFSGQVKSISTETFEHLYGEPVPVATWNRRDRLDVNDSLAQMVYAKSPLARLGIKILIGLRNRSVKKGNPDLNLFFLSNMPFRAIAKMSNGAFSMDMTRSLLIIVNGQFFKGVGRLIQSFNRYRKRGSRPW